MQLRVSNIKVWCLTNCTFVLVNCKLSWRSAALHCKGSGSWEHTAGLDKLHMHCDMGRYARDRLCSAALL